MILAIPHIAKQIQHKQLIVSSDLKSERKSQSYKKATGTLEERKKIVTTY
jgi:hypothetical protein